MDARSVRRRARHGLYSSLAAVLALAPAAWAADAGTTGGDDHGNPIAPAPAQPDTPSLSVDQLLTRLPDIPGRVQRDGKVWWDDGKGNAYQFAPVPFDHDNPLLVTPIGTLAVARKLVADDRRDVLAALPVLIGRAQAAGLKGSDLLVAESILAGIHLRSPLTIVLAEGVVRKATAPEIDADGDKKAVATAATVVEKALADTNLDELGRKCTTDVLERMDDDDGNTAIDEVAPSFARRVMRFGWLRPFFPAGDQPAVAKLEAAIAAAEAFRPKTLFTGTGDGGAPLRLAEVHNAYGTSGWILQTPARSAFTRKMAAPEYRGEMPDLNLVVELPAGADPLGDARGFTAARLYRSSNQVVASWTPDAGFKADADEWRKLVPARGAGVDVNACADFLPPCIVVSALDGDAVAIATGPDPVGTGGGLLLAPRDGGPGECERFLADAARELTDAPHLDLVGEYLFTYVYDSPDSRYWFLIGNKDDKGDIHQTAVQTLSTTCGGFMRGDCDDLAELYQTLAVRQGRTCHVVSLPQHAAAAWAESKADKQWHVFVLQTGPALEFTDAELPKALEKAYRSFDSSTTFDPNGLGLLLRFSGENTRSGWRLSWRIFKEPDYARTMIDVQKDWHFQTYQRGITTMLKLIQDGDDDNANYRELSGLYSFTGQYDNAIKYHRAAMTRTTDPLSRLYMDLELIQHLYSAAAAQKADGKPDLAAARETEARTEALSLLDDQIPKQKDKMGMAQVQVGVELAGTLSGHADDLALRALRELVIPAMGQRVDRIADWLDSDEFKQETWDMTPQFQQLRRLTQMYSGTGIAALKQGGSAHLTTDPTLQTLARSVQTWLDHIAFRDTDEPSEAMMRYASAAGYYDAILGDKEFDALLFANDADAKPGSASAAATASGATGATVPAAAGLPLAAQDHRQRLGGLAQLPLDLPWIRISVPYWYGRLAAEMNKDGDLDRAEMARLGRHLEEAYAAGERLGIHHPQIEFEHHLGRLLVALAAQDAAGVKARLDFVVEKNDKRLRDDTAQWLGDAAKKLPLDWYRQVLGLWNTEVHYKAKYFWIAWRAALARAPYQALMAADLAASEFKDDPAFTEEAAAMHQQFGAAAQDQFRKLQEQGK
jgi:hypothetical protein